MEKNYFVSDYQLSQNSQYPAVQLGYNKDLLLNSISYLVDRTEDISSRKDTGTVTYTATAQQDLIIRIIIFAVPILIILAGIIVWQVRRRKKIIKYNKVKSREFPCFFIYWYSKINTAKQREKVLKKGTICNERCLERATT